MLLLAFAGLLFKLHYTGEISSYINMKYSLLSQAASVLFILLFLIQFNRIWAPRHVHSPETCELGHEDCDHDHGGTGWSLKTLLAYAIIGFPLITGYSMPSKTLDAAMASKKGTVLAKPVAHSEAEEHSEGLHADKIDEFEGLQTIVMTESDFVSYAETITMHPDRVAGKKIKISGFVYREPEMEREHLLISRFMISHCVADAGMIGFLTEWDNADLLEEDTWVELEGTLEVTQTYSHAMPIIKVENWKEIHTPAMPYVYP
ncbi:TIGR03943 family protein [Paenibacillus sp. TRM 82003]|nr:TIGR03943 family protein [Paenibacillus sp. TRM 82003]